MATTDYPDTNGNGVPDAFENRLPLVEILNAADDPQASTGTLIVEIEKHERSPRRGDYFICGGLIKRATFNYGPFQTICIRRIIAGDVSDIPDA